MNSHEENIISRLITIMELLVEDNRLKQQILIRIVELEAKIMATTNDLMAAAVTLSTAADGLSVKVDKLVEAADKVLAAFKGGELTSEQTAALAKLQTSSATAAAEGDKVDAEVTKLDSALPAPAPPATP